MGSPFENASSSSMEKTFLASPRETSIFHILARADFIAPPTPTLTAEKFFAAGFCEVDAYDEAGLTPSMNSALNDLEHAT